MRFPARQRIELPRGRPPLPRVRERSRISAPPFNPPFRCSRFDFYASYVPRSPLPAHRAILSPFMAFPGSLTRIGMKDFLRIRPRQSRISVSREERERERERERDCQRVRCTKSGGRTFDGTNGTSVSRAVFSSLSRMLETRTARLGWPREMSSPLVEQDSSTGG